MIRYWVLPLSHRQFLGLRVAESTSTAVHCLSQPAEHAQRFERRMDAPFVSSKIVDFLRLLDTLELFHCHLIQFFVCEHFEICLAPAKKNSISQIAWSRAFFSCTCVWAALLVLIRYPVGLNRSHFWTHKFIFTHSQLYSALSMAKSLIAKKSQKKDRTPVFVSELKLVC